MKVVLLTGSQPNQKALAHKIARSFEVAAIVVSENIPRRAPSWGRKARTLVNRVGQRTVGRPLVETWFQMQAEYDRLYPDFPAAEIIAVKNVNDAATFDALAKHRPHLAVVSGTNLVGKKLIGAAGRIVNLHTGISPYVKGGPNCTNWCLAKNWFHLIGNTIMWLDAGIDTGSLIATERTPLDGRENLFELHWRVMEHAHDLYGRALGKIAAGAPVPGVPQGEIGEGSLFYTADWNWREMRRALRNFETNYAKFFADREQREKLAAEVRLISLETN